MDDETTFGLRVMLLSTSAILCSLNVDSCGLFTATAQFYSLEAAGSGSGSGDWTTALRCHAGCFGVLGFNCWTEVHPTDG